MTPEQEPVTREELAFDMVGFNRSLADEFDKLFESVDPSKLADIVMSRDQMEAKTRADQERKCQSFCHPDKFTEECLSPAETLVAQVDKEHSCMVKAMEIVSGLREDIVKLGCIRPTELLISTMVFQAKLGEDGTTIKSKKLRQRMQQDDIQALLTNLDEKHTIKYRTDSRMHNVIMTVSLVPRRPSKVENNDDDVYVENNSNTTNDDDVRNNSNKNNNNDVKKRTKKVNKVPGPASGSSEAPGPSVTEPKKTPKRKRSKRQPMSDVGQDVRINDKAILVFSNGKLHVVGCISVEECCECVTTVSKLLEKATGQELPVTRVETEMINCNFGLENHVLNLDKARECLARLQQENFKVNYCKERHAGVQIKFGASTTNIVTIMLFHSGSVIINGFTKGAELRDAYEFITRFLHAHIHAVGKVKDATTGSQGRKKRTKRDDAASTIGQPDAIDFLRLIMSHREANGF